MFLFFFVLVSQYIKYAICAYARKSGAKVLFFFGLHKKISQKVVKCKLKTTILRQGASTMHLVH